MHMSRKSWYLRLVPGADWQSSQLVRENSDHAGRWMWTRFPPLLIGLQSNPPPPRPHVIFSGDYNLPNLSLRKTPAPLPVWWNTMPLTSILPWHLFRLNWRGFGALICARCLFFFSHFCFFQANILLCHRLKPLPPCRHQKLKSFTFFFSYIKYIKMSSPYISKVKESTSAALLKWQMLFKPKYKYDKSHCCNVGESNLLL